jgi:very-short-patch-repair endonuclease
MKGYKFRRQYSVGAFILDFYCPEARLAVELDGQVHANPLRREYDCERQQHLEELGIRVLRFENRLVFEQPDCVIEAIAAALDSSL